MDVVQAQAEVGNNRPEILSELNDVWLTNYHLFLVKEASAGRSDGIADPEKMFSIIDREMALGRMLPDDSTCAITLDYLPKFKTATVTESPSLFRRMMTWIGG